MGAMENLFIKFRKDKNLNLTQAAARCGVNKSTYLRWQNGQARVAITSLDKVSKATGYSRKKLRPDIFGATQ